MSSPRRSRRMASVVHAELAKILLEEVSDPRVRGVTVTEVDLSPDLKNAHVFYSAHSHPKETARGIQSAVPFVRRRLGERLALRHVPVLTFEEDNHTESVVRVMGILDSLGKPSSEERV